MVSPAEVRELASELGAAASGDDESAWRAGLRRLEGLDGAAWLQIDQAARSLAGYWDRAPVSGTRGWLGPTLTEPSGFVAAVTALHADGRIRERAVQVLGATSGALAMPALALRLLDHVPQVRARAREVLHTRLHDDDIDAALDVLLAASRRQHAHDALDHVTAALLAAVPAEMLVARLTASARRQVRRWAFVLGHDHNTFTVEQLVAAAQADRDQWVQAACAQWLAELPDASILRPLLRARSAEVRLVALNGVVETDLDDDPLASLLVDPSPRVRVHARARAERRGWDTAEVYRRRLAEHPAPRGVVACLEGLTTSGNADDLDVAVRHLQHPSPRVRTAAVTAVRARATRDVATDLLIPMLLDLSTRVGATAARVLARLGLPPSRAEEAWASEHPSARRAAWRLGRDAGGWHRVEADLRLAVDPDDELSAHGRTGIRDWLAVSAARTWATLADAQRDRIATLLVRADLTDHERRKISFHAGIPFEERRRASTRDGDPPSSPARRRRWLRLIRGR